MVLVLSNMPMALNHMRENGERTSEKDMEYLIALMVEIIKENGKMTNIMVKENTYGLTEDFMKVVIKMAYKMGLGYMAGQVVQNMKVIGGKAFVTDKENIQVKMEKVE